MSLITEKDTRAILHLLGEVAAIEGDFPAQKRFVMDGLSRLVRADSWAWAITCKFTPDEVPLSSAFLSNGFSPEQFAKFMEALEHPDTARLNAHFIHEYERKQAHLTRLRHQVDVEGHFPNSAVYPIWLAAGVEHVILSISPIPAGGLSHIGIYRRPGNQPFNERESRIAHIVLSEVPWLHEASLPANLRSGVAKLPPRERITLNLLLEGQSRANIAKHLGLSPHTVDGYVKQVFARFGVHSQPELITRFRLGDGGDRP